MKSNSTLCVIATAILVLVPGCGSDSYSWCENLDEAVGAVWDHLDTISDIPEASDWVHTYYVGGLESYQDVEPLSDEELESLVEALDEATNEGRRFAGREAVRAWEDSLRGNC